MIGGPRSARTGGVLLLDGRPEAEARHLALHLRDEAVFGVAPEEVDDLWLID